ncbi:MAG: c-type cytochrome [Alphaproteobacteria bacterium]
MTRLQDGRGSRRWKGYAGAAAAAVIAIAAGLYLTRADAPTGADAADPGLVARGARVYAENCAVCHGDKLQGETGNWRQRKADGTLPAPPHDASGHTWHHPDRLLFDITKRGGQATAPPGFKSAMPAFAETLDDGDIWAVLAFIKSRWPVAVQARQESINRRSR